MQFSKGLLGVMVVAVSLAIALLGSWALSSDVQEVPYTDYNYVTDLDGLFETSKSPEYIEYNPSSNYTGYYTDESMIGTYKYFAGVNYTASKRANDYWLNLMPTDESEGVYDLTNLDYDVSHPVVTYMDYDAAIIKKDTYEAIGMTLSSLVNDMIGDGEQNVITLKSIENILEQDNVDGTNLEVNSIIFSIKTDWHTSSNYHFLYLMTPAFKEYRDRNSIDPNIHYVLPLQSARINLSSQLVELFYDNDLENSAGLFSLSDVWLVFGGDEFIIGDDLILGNSLDYYQAISHVSYMDPSKGVELI